MLHACRAVRSYFNLWTVPERDNCQEVMQNSKYTLQGTNTHRRDLRLHETRKQLQCGRALLPIPSERLSKNSQDRGNVLVLRIIVLSPCHFDCPPSQTIESDIEGRLSRCKNSGYIWAHTDHAPRRSVLSLCDHFSNKCSRSKPNRTRPRCFSMQTKKRSMVVLLAANHLVFFGGKPDQSQRHWILSNPSRTDSLSLRPA